MGGGGKKLVFSILPGERIKAVADTGRVDDKKLASAEVVEFVGERRAEATVGESGAGARRAAEAAIGSVG